MTDKVSYSNIIWARLYRPTVVSDYIQRPRLKKLLDKGADCRLTLVSAPAGYGKSQLVSSWLESSDRLFCWVSLDEEMSDFTVLVSYLVASIRQLFPEACKKIQDLKNSPEAHSPQEISLIFLDELMEIKAPFVMVLDDYGFIHNQDIHELIIKLCKYAPQSLQLVLLSRRDPPFPLNSLRAKAELVEIRQKDLQYTSSEAAAFLDKAGNISLSDKSKLLIHEKFEGWPAGLRFIVLSLHERDKIDDFLRELKADSRHIQEYLISEVLSCQSSSMREGLLKTSILKRYCASLYKALCHSDCEEPCGSECDGQLFIKKIQESNLFCIALDDRQEWFRFHHLFQDFLQQSLYRRYEPEEIEEMHQIASTWFEGQGLLEDSFYHALKLTDSEIAIQLVTRHRQELMNQEKWHTLHNWLAKLPEELINNKADLLITKAWICENQKRIPEMMKLLDRAESLLKGKRVKPVNYKELKGEINTMKSGYYYLNGNSRAALKYVTPAIEALPPSNSSALAYAILVASLSYQMVGDLERAQRIVYDALQQAESHSSTYYARLLLTLCWLDWLEGDLIAARKKAEQLVAVGRKAKLQESMAFGYFYMGVASYYLNELDIAEKHLLKAIDTGFIADWNTYTHSSFVLALIYFFSGQQDKAAEVLESFMQRALQANNMSRLQLGETFQADLNLRQGNSKAAQHLVSRAKLDQLHQVLRFFAPQLTFARVLLAHGTDKNRDQQQSLLQKMQKFYKSIHNRRCLIEVLIMQAMFYDSMGNEAEADKKLSEALTMAEPGGNIRSFLDQGPVMSKLLDRQDLEGPLAEYLQQLKNAFVESDPDKEREKRAGGPDDNFTNLLTNREQEILELFAKRMSNQEIAEKLFIADNTVKRHATNIFRKLDVKNRRQAVAKANNLGITN